MNPALHAATGCFLPRPRENSSGESRLWLMVYGGFPWTLLGFHVGNQQTVIVFQSTVLAATPM